MNNTTSIINIILNTLTHTFSAYYSNANTIEHPAHFTYVLNARLAPLFSNFHLNAPKSILSDAGIIKNYLKVIFNECGYTQREKLNILSLFTYHFKFTAIPQGKGFYQIRVSLYDKYLLDDVYNVTLGGHGSTNLTIFIPTEADEETVNCIARGASEAILKQSLYW